MQKTKSVNIPGPHPSNARVPRQNLSVVGPSRASSRIEDESPVSMNRRNDSGIRNQWKKWSGVRVKLLNLPTRITIRDLWKCLSEEGTLTSIEIFDDRQNPADGSALVIFRYGGQSCLQPTSILIRVSPPPARAFWEIKQYNIAVSATEIIAAGVRLEGCKREFFHPSPNDPTLKYPELTVSLPYKHVSAGVLIHARSFVPKHCNLASC